VVYTAFMFLYDTITSLALLYLDNKDDRFQGWKYQYNLVLITAPRSIL